MVKRNIILIVVILAAAAAVWFFSGHKQGSLSTNSPGQTVASVPMVVPPVSDFQTRVTKKPFGIYVTPKNSPVSPEKFTGYHMGADFETSPSEQNIDVLVNVICTGKLLMKKWASGYGGVTVQSCTINNQAVTVIYGHLNIDTVTPSVGQLLNFGDHLAMLGKGYSQQTDGERKHLHLGIHKGTAINILGYTQNKADLSNWIDPLTVLK